MLIPQMIVRDMAEAVAFYTEVLDFQAVPIGDDLSGFYAVLIRGGDEMHLNLTPGQGRYGHCSAIVVCEDVDALFALYRSRGLNTPTRPGSPVHEAPLDQTWGTREFYVDDPSGNTLVFQQR